MKKLMALLAALALVAAVPMTALADDEGKMPDPNKPGSITVHKFTTDTEPDEPGNGLEITDPTKLDSFGEPIAGVGFTLYKVSESYKIDENTTPAQAKANATIVKAEDTDADGKIVFDGLESVRYYVLEETNPPAGNYIPMDMVIISVPYGVTGTGEGWNYDVHVYPKNVDSTEVTKEIDEEEPKYFVGDTVSWKISSRVNSEIRAGEPGTYTYGYFRFKDTLDERLDYVADGETVTSTLRDGTTVTYVRGDDYTANFNSTTRVVTFTFTEDGIDKMLDNKAGRVDILFDTTVNDKIITNNPGDDKEIIDNDVTKEWSNHDGTDEKTATPDDKPEAKLAYIELMKIDFKEKTIKLNDAEFKIALSEADAKAGTFMKDSNGNDIVVKTGEHTGLAGETDGYGVFMGLRHSKDSDTSYYLVEVKAPSAPSAHPKWEYVLRPDAIKVTIPAASVSQLATIENTRVGEDGPGPIFKLPLTGGKGAALIIAVGIILIAGGAVALKKSSKHKAN